MTDRKNDIKKGTTTRVVVPPSPECGNMETAIEGIRRMFVDRVQHDHIVDERQTPAKRAAFIKQHGSAHAVFQVSDDLEEKYRVGIFQPGAHYEAWIRFSSDIPDERPDKNSTVGVGIKLFGVTGEKALEEDVNAETLDFVLQNTEVFFAADAMEMCEFKTAALNGTLPQWRLEHPETDAILTEMANKSVESALTERLWSCIPYKFGPDDYCKYILSVQSAADPTTPIDENEPNYLAKDLQERLVNGGAKLDFFVQLRNDPDQSLINARNVWDETLAVPVKVATLIIPQQDITARGQGEYGEVLSYNIWRTLPEMAPVGSIAEARKVVYRSSSQTRRDVNGQPVGEPTRPRPPGAPVPPYDSTFEQPWPPSKAGDSEVAYAVIHPGIGVARVGNSATEFYIGPEYASAPPPPFGSTRDGTGAIKRQAARFRIYGYNSAGVAVKELTPDNADIEWEVQVANTKAAWFAFDMAMDVPDAKAVPRRNPLVTGAARDSLAIRPTARTISGKNANGVQFDDGLFVDVPVNLGELRTDASGRLLVLGGHGVSASPSGAPLVIIDDGVEQNFNNSVDWYDDTADGPVSATVHVNGNPIPVQGAWVVVAPPDYAPGIVAFRSMYDMARHAVVDAGIIPPDGATSYSKDVVPLLRRLSDLQWVNLGFAEAFGIDGSNPVSSSLIRALPLDEGAAQRFDIYAQFRSPEDMSVPVGSALKWPQLYGDGLAEATPSSADDVLPVAPRTYAHLANFVQSNFENDLDLTEYPVVPRFPEHRYAMPIEESPIAEQPARLDEGPLSYCVADAFHPGCELTWPMRHATLYDGLARIRRREDSVGEPVYGDTLTPQQAVAEGGPLHAQGPGDLTRWMALPWQGDTARCRSGYDPEFHPFLPSFWPARVPNDVLTEENYLTYMNTSLSDGARKGAFQQRDKWLRTFLMESQDNETVMQAMVDRFDEMGIVQLRPGPPDYASDMVSVYVEQLKPGAIPLSKAAAAFGGRIDGSPIPGREALLQEAGWTEEAWDAFRRKR